MRHRDQSERAIARLERHLAVLPQTLQRAKRPAEALLDQPTDGVGRFGPGDGLAVVQHPIAGPEQRYGQVLVFGERVGREAA